MRVRERCPPKACGHDRHAAVISAKAGILPLFSIVGSILLATGICKIISHRIYPVETMNLPPPAVLTADVTNKSYAK